MIEVKIVADSVGPSRVRITSMLLTYPRFAHAELMTHRVFSRNASSSRAIPVTKQIQMVKDNPVIPIKFTANQRGMQGGAELEDAEFARNVWLSARDQAVNHAVSFAAMGLHKQYANRVLEPFAHITVMLTSTEWANWFALRHHPMALPEMQELARQMFEARRQSKPARLMNGEWHRPLIQDSSDFFPMEAFQTDEDGVPNIVKMSVARCARTSYLNHEGKHPTVQEDLELFNKLAVSEPLHASPAEHQAMAIGDPNVRSGNFRGWIQYRKTLPNENVSNWEGKVID